MRFDAGRVAARADSLDFPRHPGTAGVARAAAEVAGALEAAGMDVRRCPAAGASPPLGFLALNLGLAATFYLVGTESAGWRTGTGVLLAAAVAIAVRWARRPPGVEAVLATIPASRTDVPRVVIAASLTDARTPPGSGALAAVQSVAWAGMFVALWWAGRIGWTGPAGPTARLAGSWTPALLAALAWWVVRVRRRPPAPGDGRTGLAMLEELARTWPRSLGKRAETWFVAAPGLAELADVLRRCGIGPAPALVIVLGNPGVGDHLVIRGGSSAHDLACHAAADLWLPFRLAVGPPLGLPLTSCSCVTLDGTNRQDPIQPTSLAATSQLAGELTLRWLKSAAGVGQES